MSNPVELRVWREPEQGWLDASAPRALVSRALIYVLADMVEAAILSEPAVPVNDGNVNRTSLRNASGGRKTT